MIKKQTIVTIDKAFRNMIQSQNYEKYVLAIISKSHVISWDLQFRRKEHQSHGESDFVDNRNHYHDTKLLFDKKQGALIGDPNNTFNDWLQEMLNG